jgi:hypothetical protein
LIERAAPLIRALSERIVAFLILPPYQEGDR